MKCFTIFQHLFNKSLMSKYSLGQSGFFNWKKKLSKSFTSSKTLNEIWQARLLSSSFATGCFKSKLNVLLIVGTTL